MVDLSFCFSLVMCYAGIFQIMLMDSIVDRGSLVKPNYLPRKFARCTL